MSNNSNLFDCLETKFIWRVGDTKTKRMKNRVRKRPPFTSSAEKMRQVLLSRLCLHSPSKNLIPRGTLKEVFTVRHITDLQATRALNTSLIYCKIVWCMVFGHYQMIGTSNQQKYQIRLRQDNLYLPSPPYNYYPKTSQNLGGT